MAISTRVRAFLNRLAAKGDVYAVGITELLKYDVDVSNISKTAMKVWKNPAAAGTTNCVAATAGNAAKPLVLAGQPDVPRSVLATFAASYDGGDIVLVGIDHTGAQITETLLANAGATRASNAAFASIISATRTAVGATANTVSLGYGVKFGVGIKPVLDGSLAGFMDGAGTTFSATDLTNGTVTFTTASDGAHDYMAISAKA
jgi:hypothetical protein